MPVVPLIEKEDVHYVPESFSQQMDKRFLLFAPFPPPTYPADEGYRSLVTAFAVIFSILVVSLIIRFFCFKAKREFEQSRFMRSRIADRLQVAPPPPPMHTHATRARELVIRMPWRVTLEQFNMIAPPIPYSRFLYVMRAMRDCNVMNFDQHGPPPSRVVLRPPSSTSPSTGIPLETYNFWWRAQMMEHAHRVEIFGDSPETECICSICHESIAGESDLSPESKPEPMLDPKPDQNTSDSIPLDPISSDSISSDSISSNSNLSDSSPSDPTASDDGHENEVAEEEEEEENNNEDYVVVVDPKIRQLPCWHVFHDECIVPWVVKRSSTCPLCKQVLTPP